MRWAAVGAIAGLTLVTLSVPGASAAPHKPSRAPVYDLSLGDSLAQGVQPDATGQSVPTDQGYADDLFAAEQASFPTLRLVKLGCPGETTATMISGGVCPYEDGTQLAEATEFLHAHRRHVAFVTIDIGANDIDGCVSGGTVDLQCLAAGFQAVQSNLPTILAALRTSAGPGVPILGMNYYDPFLAAWLTGPAGQSLAVESEQLAVQFNALLGALYGGAGSAVADVQSAFATTDFSDLVTLPGFGLVPLNVFDICVWTWMCAPPPQGPNIHANQAGYEQIAEAFEAIL